MAFRDPTVPAPSGDERDLLLAFAAWQREQVVATVADLTDEQARWQPEGKLLPILAVIDHLTGMETRWIEGRYLDVPIPPPHQELPTPPADLTLAAALVAYERRAARTEEIVRAAPSLDEPLLGRNGGEKSLQDSFGFDRPPSLRYALLHVIEETAHHAGHADATRELLDGAKMRP